MYIIITRAKCNLLMENTSFDSQMSGRNA